MTPQLVDLNADGHNDMVMGTYEGVAWAVYGSESGFQKPKKIVDAENRPVLVSLYWDDKTGNFLNKDRSPKNEKHPEDHGTSVAAVDWDNDGDLDLLLGTYEGHLFLRRNVGSTTEPKFALTNEQVRTGEKPLEVPGGMTNCRAVDWNSDGLTDLICGGVEGGVFYFENNGNKSTPKFTQRSELLPQLAPTELEDDFPIRVAPHDADQPLAPGSAMHVEVVDYDRDGKLDLLVGGQSTWFSKPPRRLSAEKNAHKAKLQKQIVRLENKLDSITADAKTEADYEKLEQDPELQKLEQKWEKLYNSFEQYENYPDKEAEFLWFYKGK